MRYFTNSEMQTFKDCRRRWWLGHYRRLRPRAHRGTGAGPLGSKVHKALAAYYVPDGETPVDPREALEAVIAAEREVIISSAPEYERVAGVLDDATTLDAELANFDGENDLARIMIEGYVQWLEETGADSEYRVLASEHPVEFEFAQGLSLAGRLDTLLERIRDGAHLSMDHKTGDFTDLRRRLPVDEQMLLYEILRRATIPGQRSVGMVLNMLRRVKRTARAKPPFYDRASHTYTTRQLESAWTRVMGVVHDVIAVEGRLAAGEPHHLVAYPRPNRDCHWKCEFYAVCSMLDDGSRAEDMLQSLFVVGEPMERYPELTGGDE